MTKTNAMRLLDAAGIAYRTAEYEYDESDLSGKHAAQQVGLPEEQVFKTLVTRGASPGGYYVFVAATRLGCSSSVSPSRTSWTCDGQPQSPATKSWR